MCATRLEGQPITEATPRRSWGRASGWLLPGVLLAIGLAARLTHLSLPFPSDQLNYLTAADAFPSPVDNATETHQITRFGLVVPLKLTTLLFGYSEAAYHAFALVAFSALLLSTYALGTLLFSRVVGAAAALTVVAVTPVFTESSDPLPDIPATALITAALALAVAIRRRRVRTSPWTLTLLGVLLAWSAMAREFTVFIWPLVPVLVFPRTRWRGLAWVALPVAVLGLTELFLCWALYDDPLARVKAVLGHGGAPSPPDIASTYRDKPRRLYIERLPKGLAAYPEGRWLLGLLTLTALGTVLWWRRLVVLAAWFALLYVPLVLLGGVLDPSAPKLRLQLIRYWFPIFPAFVLGGLGALWLAATLASARLPTRLPKRAAIPPVLVAGFAAITIGLAAHGWWDGPRATQLSAFRSWMTTHGQSVPQVWSDRRTHRILEVYKNDAFGGTAWTARLRSPRPGGDGPSHGDIVVFYDTGRGDLCGVCRAAAREAWGDPLRPAPTWRQVFTTRDGLLRAYQVP